MWGSGASERGKRGARGGAEGLEEPGAGVALWLWGQPGILGSYLRSEPAWLLLLVFSEFSDAGCFLAVGVQQSTCAGLPLCCSPCPYLALEQWGRELGPWRPRWSALAESVPCRIPTDAKFNACPPPNFTLGITSASSSFPCYTTPLIPVPGVVRPAAAITELRCVRGTSVLCPPLATDGSGPSPASPCC